MLDQLNEVHSKYFCNYLREFPTSLCLELTMKVKMSFTQDKKDKDFHSTFLKNRATFKESEGFLVN